MARLDASDLALSLGRQAEAVCRHYLGNGRRQGNYWQVGDARNTKGRSMYVRLKDSPKGQAGKWTEHVAARFMLRRCGWALFYWWPPAWTQHNVRSWRGIS